MRTPRTVGALCLMLLPTALLVGCGPLIGWVVNAWAPPQKVNAKYVPPANKKVLVFVDDILNPVSYEPIKADLTEALNRQLTEHKIVARTVAYEDLLTLMVATPKFNELAVSEVGGKLGADIVLYVQMDEFSLKDNEVTPLWRGRLAVSVRVVDVRQGRLWPEDRPAGYPVKPVETPARSEISETYGTLLAKQLAIMMADRIAKLFYKHEVPAREMAQEQEGF